jgi:hypothetical protein
MLLELAAASTRLLELDAGELALVGAGGASTTLLELDVDAGELAGASTALLELELALVGAAGAEEALLELELELDAGEVAGASTTLLELDVDAGEVAGASTTLLELDVDAGELALVDAAGAEDGLLELDAGELAAASTTLLELALVGAGGASTTLLELELDAGELAAASTTLLELAAASTTPPARRGCSSSTALLELDLAGAGASTVAPPRARNVSTPPHGIQLSRRSRRTQKSPFLPCSRASSIPVASAI